MKLYVRGSDFCWRPAAICVVFFLLLLSTVFAAGGAESAALQEQTSPGAPGIYPMTVVDALGNRVFIEQEPQRIASLTLFTDEIFFDLVETERLLVITNLASDKVYSNVADRADEVAAQLVLTVETLIELEPDIIFTATWSDANKVEQLRRAGLTVYSANSPVTIEGIQEEILKLGRMLNAEGRAQAIVHEMDELLNAVSASLESLPAAERRSAMDYNSWGTANGSGSSWNAILEAAGVENALALFEADDYGQVPVSRELLVELNPDVIFLPGWIWGDPEGAENFEQEVKGDPALQTLNAIRSDRLYLVPANLKTTLSQYIADAVLMVARLVYPEYMQ